MESRISIFWYKKIKSMHNISCYVFSTNFSMSLLYKSTQYLKGIGSIPFIPLLILNPANAATKAAERMVHLLESLSTQVGKLDEIPGSWLSTWANSGYCGHSESEPMDGKYFFLSFLSLNMVCLFNKNRYIFFKDASRLPIASYPLRFMAALFITIRSGSSPSTCHLKNWLTRYRITNRWHQDKNYQHGTDM